MSTILEKSTPSSVIVKRSFFLRTSSIQKIKCSATYPFRLAGTKLNRDAIKELIEVLIIKGRVISHKALLNLYIATFKLVGAMCTLWDRIYAKKVCDKSKKTDGNLSFQQKLLGKIQRLQHYKSGPLEPKTTIRSNRTATAAVERVVDQQQQKESTCSTKFQTDIAKLRDLAAQKLKQKGFASLDASVTSPQTIKSNDYLLSCIVYGSAFLVYLQLLFLAVALNSTSLPPGLVFLTTSIAFIGVVAFKVFFLANMRKIELRAHLKDSESSSKPKNTAAIQPPRTLARQSRSRVKIVMELSSKTLSKIKLL